MDILGLPLTFQTTYLGFHGTGTNDTNSTNQTSFGGSKTTQKVCMQDVLMSLFYNVQNSIHKTIKIKFNSEFHNQVKVTVMGKILVTTYTTLLTGHAEIKLNNVCNFSFGETLAEYI